MTLGARARLIEEHLPLVATLARRFDHRGESLEDLVQVGALGLIKAVDRFEPERGVRLEAFAAPTIAGEIQRHLRDRTWPLTVPRRLRETSRPAEFVDPSARADDAAGQADLDQAERGEDRAVLAPALESLDARKREIVELRFYRDLSQPEIARRLGISQAQVSRLLGDALAALRAAIGPEEPPAGDTGAQA
jgi:RNA polymerase sigma-B factor